jgi:3'5'-cyclic nucleotide phosphodiesterase
VLGSPAHAQTSSQGLTKHWDDMQTLSFDALQVDAKKGELLVAMVFDRIGLRDKFTDARTMTAFVHALAGQYISNNPYHNWHHAIDVFQSTYRFIVVCEASMFLSELEIYSLLLAALAHDAGHFALSK